MAEDDKWPKKVIEGSKCTQTHLYKHPWELMLAAYDARFVDQTHPRLPNLVGWTLTDRTADDQRGLETYVRTITVSGDVPWLVAKATGLETLEIVQTVEVDRLRRRISMMSKNTTWRDRLQMDEDCSYFADPAQPAWTGFKQTATLSVSLGGYGIESTVEGFLISAYSDGIDKGRVVDEELVKDIQLQGGSLDLRPWAEKHPHLASQLTPSSTLSAKMYSKKLPEPEPEPEPEPQTQPEMDTETQMEKEKKMETQDTGTEHNQQPSSATVIDVNAANPHPGPAESAPFLSAKPIVAVVGHPSFVGIPIPQALFHPPPDEPIVSAYTPHLFGWKIPDMLFGSPAL